MTSTFAGSTAAVGLAPAAVVRITPALHVVGNPPPFPPAGSAVTIRTSAVVLLSSVVSSSGAEIVLRADGKSWRLTPLKPTEIHSAASRPEGSGASDWVVRGEA
jgi:hypothetical protein